jgi:hypothetical protein
MLLGDLSQILFQQYRPNCDMGWIEMPQRGSLLPYRGGAILSLQAWKHRAVKRRDFITLLGGMVAFSPTVLTVSTSSANRLLMLTASSRARSRPICRCRYQLSTRERFGEYGVVEHLRPRRGRTGSGRGLR